MEMMTSSLNVYSFYDWHAILEIENKSCRLSTGIFAAIYVKCAAVLNAVNVMALRRVTSLILMFLQLTKFSGILTTRH